MLGTLVEWGTSVINAYQSVTEWLSYGFTIGNTEVTVFSVIFGGLIFTFITVAIIKWIT